MKDKKLRIFFKSKRYDILLGHALKYHIKVIWEWGMHVEGKKIDDKNWKVLKIERKIITNVGCRNYEVKRFAKAQKPITYYRNILSSGYF